MPNTAYRTSEASSVYRPAWGGRPARLAYAIISGIYGGLGRPTENFLPPGYPQYKKIDAWHFDLAAAKKLVQESGTSGQTVDVYGANEDPTKSTTEYLSNQLSKIGYNRYLKFVWPFLVAVFLVCCVFIAIAAAVG